MGVQALHSNQGLERAAAQGMENSQKGIAKALAAGPKEIEKSESPPQPEKPVHPDPPELAQRGLETKAAVQRDMGIGALVAEMA